MYKHPPTNDQCSVATAKTGRRYCQDCHYPQSVCICDQIEKIATDIRIVVLQHPSEARHAKNSVRLLPLCLPQVSVYQGESSDDFASLRQELASSSSPLALFYPSTGSTGLESGFAGYVSHPPQTLLFIDATWRKAYKMWQLNPWLRQLKSWHFEHPPQSQYRIRKTSVAGGLSTLEAVAYALETGHQVETAPLLSLFNTMQSRTQHGRA